MTRKLKILFAPLDAVGHVSSAIGMAEVLINRGHDVIFAVGDQWKGRLLKYGIQEVLFQYASRISDANPYEHWTELFFEGGAIKSATLFEIAINMTTKIFPFLMDELKEVDLKVGQLLRDIRPDVVIVDHVLTLPSVELSGIPWVLVCSNQPLLIFQDERLPPWSSGLASKGEEMECDLFRHNLNEATLQVWHNWNNYIISRGLEPLKDFQFFRHSKYLNVYAFPSELDYTDIIPQPPKMYRFDNFMRTDKHLKFKIPDKLKGKPGKLIYFSMGSMGGGNVDLMMRLINILKKSKHRFIVSKGANHHKFELPDNMWGQPSLPQIQVISLVDLVITHGGNNTVSETFSFGKPMIVLPLFSDQPDNAQRIQEKGFGLRLDAYNCTESELLNAIECLLNDRQLNEKLKKISKRIQSDNSIAKLPQIIESLVTDQNNN